MAAMIVGAGTLLTFGDECRVIANGALLLDGGLIADIGDTATLRARYPAAALIDARGQYILPGMICAHTHTYGAFARGMALKDAPPDNFMQILQRLWWRLDRALQPDDVYYSALVCLVDAIRHGVTTLMDHHASPNACAGSLDVVAQAFGQAGVRGCLCYEVSDRDGKEKATAGIRENVRFARMIQPSPPTPPSTLGEGSVPPPGLGWGSMTPPELGGGGRPIPMLAALMGLHAAFTLADETIRDAVAAAHKMGVGCHIHVAEDRADLQHSLDVYGERTVERLARLGVLGPQTIAAHCIHVDEREMRILAETGTLVAHNPRSNMNNAVGTARVSEMLERGVCVGLGTDGFSNDMLAEMKAAYLGHKAATGNPQAMPAGIVQKLAVANNARIAGAVFAGPQRPARLGELAVGAAADVVLLDYHPPTPLTAANLPWHMLFGMDGGMVTTTIVNGRVLMHDRQLLALDESAIFARARGLAAALWERL